MKCIYLFLFPVASFLQAGEQEVIVGYARDAQKRTELQEKAYIEHNKGTVYEAFPDTNLLRFYLDVTGDGVPELFVSNTLDAEVTAPWEVFQRRGDAYLRTASGLQLNPRGFYQNDAGAGVELAGYERGEDLKYNIIGYRFNVSGQAQSIGRELNEKERDLIRSGGIQGKAQLGLSGMQRPTVEIVGTKAYLADPAVAWATYDRDRAPRDQIIEPGRFARSATKEASFVFQEQSKKDAELKKTRIEVVTSKPLAQPETPGTFKSGNAWFLAVVVGLIGIFIFLIYRSRGGRGCPSAKSSQG